jgi:CHAT domain-containing protein/tetratricopeptide (TPR) repeat protein
MNDDGRRRSGAWYESGRCPDDETIAEYVEGGLTPFHRERLEEHLAACRDCGAIYASSVAFLADWEERRRAARPAPVLRRTSALRLATAAGVAGFVAGASLLWLPRDQPEADPRAALVATAPPARPITTRLTGGFRWAPVVRGAPATRGAVTPDVVSYVALARAAVVGEAATSPAQIGAAGAGQALIGQLDEAVDSLSRAVAADPGSPELLSDLGAVLVARAERADGGADVAAGLEAIERSLAASPRLPEALFNRALALERMHLPISARKAWRAFLAVDASSPWAAEARRRLASVPSAASPDALHIGAYLVAPAAAGDGRLVELVRRYRGQARRTVQEELLPGWAEALATGDGTAAERHLSSARAIAVEWEAQTADPTLRLAVEEVQAAVGRRREGLVRGYRGLGEAARALARFDLPVAEKAAAAALAALPRQSPAGAWARLVRLTSSYFAGKPDAAADLAVLEQTAATDLATRGRARWYVGSSRLRQGDFMGALSAYREALSLYERLDDRDAVASLQYHVSEMYGLVGQIGPAWSYRLQALATAPTLAARERSFSILLGSAVMALTEDRLRVASALLDELEVRRQATEPHDRAEIYLCRARIATALGNRQAARLDLQRATAWADRAEPGARLHLTGELELARGLLTPEPRAAVAVLDRAAAAFAASSRPARLPSVLVARAAAHRRMGDLAAAEENLVRALEMRASQGRTPKAGLASRPLDGAAGAVDELVDLFVESGRLDAALSVLERARTRSASTVAAWKVGSSSDGSAATPLPIRDLLSRVGRGTIVLSYAVLEDRTIVWAITHDDVAAVDVPKGRRELLQLRDRLVVDLGAGAWSTLTRRAAVALHAALLPPTVLRKGQALVIVPDEELAGIPFAALIDPASGRYLVEDRAVTVAPSASLYIHARERWRRLSLRPPQSAMVIGDPQLDALAFPGLPALAGARDEAIRVADLYPSRELLIGEAATGPALLAGVGRREVLHFAGHTVPNRSAPGMSSLALADDGSAADGILYADEIAGLSLPATRTVVLSACHTAGEPLLASEGSMNLARAFLAADVPTVVASLWRVDDQASAPLLIALHRRLRAGEAPASALRAAQLSFIRSAEPGSRSPVVWAGFEALGG